MGEQVVAGFYGGVAQLGEHLPCKQGVKSSNLSISIHLSNTIDESYRNHIGILCTLKTVYCQFMPDREKEAE